MENDFQRQKRERGFQQQVLAALDKPKANRLLAILNSAFFLWIMTAIFLTVGGAFFTAAQQCSIEANKQADLYSDLTSQIIYRGSRIREMIEQASNIEAIKKNAGVLVREIPSLREKPLLHLIRQRNQILRQSEPDSDDKRRDRWNIHLSEVSAPVTNALGTAEITELDDLLSRFQDFVAWGDTSRIVPADLPRLKAWAKLKLDFETLSETELTPNCGPSTVANRMIGRSPPITSVKYNGLVFGDWGLDW
ncbi:MAG: hypothetical protein AB1490_05310 [Pseudomonadota bacterium]